MLKTLGGCMIKIDRLGVASVSKTERQCSNHCDLALLRKNNLGTKSWNLANPEKIKQYRRDWYANNKEHAKSKIYERREEMKAWFNGIKSKLKCEQCGEDHFACLDFHHNDPKLKEIVLSQVIYRGWSKEKILLEMDKCGILCSNCHRKYHWSD